MILEIYISITSGIVFSVAYGLLNLLSGLTVDDNGQTTWIVGKRIQWIVALWTGLEDACIWLVGVEPRTEMKEKVEKQTKNNNS